MLCPAYGLSLARSVKADLQGPSSCFGLSLHSSVTVNGRLGFAPFSMSVWCGCFSCKNPKTQSKTKKQKLSSPSLRKRKKGHGAWILRTQRYLTKCKGTNVTVLHASLEGLEPESGSPLCLTLSVFCYGFFCCSNLQLPHVILQLQPHRETNSTFLWFKFQIPREENLIGSAWIECPPLVQSSVLKGWAHSPGGQGVFQVLKGWAGVYCKVHLPRKKGVFWVGCPPGLRLGYEMWLQAKLWLSLHSWASGDSQLARTRLSHLDAQHKRSNRRIHSTLVKPAKSNFPPH